MKQCSTCRETKPLEAFNKNRARHDGVQNACRACQSKYDKGLYAADVKRRKDMRTRLGNVIRMKKAYIQMWLQSHSCVDCSESDVRCLDFDHVRGKKRMNISDMVASGGWSLATLKTEIAKCDIRCANCHRKRTHTVRHRGVA